MLNERSTGRQNSLEALRGGSKETLGIHGRRVPILPGSLMANRRDHSDVTSGCWILPVIVITVVKPALEQGR
ncbi:hypothetical protein C8Q78DRAFT_652730 [Trametes maxima]|nr:hypothetical protein C8Q78DRAFT_652730 [Trametes maxima]